MRAPSIRLCLPIALLACSAADSPRPSASVRDRAGIRIVESAAADLPLWFLTEPHEVHIGVADGVTEYLFDQVGAALRLDDGRIVVADGRPWGPVAELRYYDATGRHIRTVGRKGRGPGEFQHVGRMMKLSGDSVLVFDNGNRRFTTYAPNGVLAHDRPADVEGIDRVSSEVPVPLGAGIAGSQLLGRTSDSRFIVQFTFRDRSVTGYARDTVFVILAAADSTRALPPYPGSEVMAASALSRWSLPFTYNAILAPWGDGVVVGSSETYELRRYDSRANLRMIVRRIDAPPNDLTDDLRDQYLASGPPGWGTTPLRIFGVTRSSQSDHVVGVLRDRDGVNYVRVYRIARAEGGSS